MSPAIFLLVRIPSMVYFYLFSAQSMKHVSVKEP